MSSNDWILTYTGRQFWPLAPRAEDVDLEDIAHALAHLCRFAGHCRVFYSVAQHSVHVSERVHSRYALEGLLHDAAEAYLCDVARPIKPALAGYEAAESQLMAVIRARFGLTGLELGGVQVADRRMLCTERRDLMHPNHWPVDPASCYPEPIVPWTPAEAKARFLARFEELYAR